ncbi:hypothetical protein chiPu_0027760 [Chiloscyllium punctatum]|uniref:Uncharacterized protein n=1 Tax=Chiloscyllium punctatum TaxID=137246 RepID=A0A401TM66_CHIPU|nr:hypothetical protein [Chiloscyllium punctatum]
MQGRAPIARRLRGYGHDTGLFPLLEYARRADGSPRRLGRQPLRGLRGGDPHDALAGRNGQSGRLARLGRACQRRGRRGDRDPALRLRAWQTALRTRLVVIAFIIAVASPRSERGHERLAEIDRANVRSLSARTALHARAGSQMPREACRPCRAGRLMLTRSRRFSLERSYSCAKYLDASWHFPAALVARSQHDWR